MPFPLIYQGLNGIFLYQIYGVVRARNTAIADLKQSNTKANLKNATTDFSRPIVASATITRISWLQKKLYKEKKL